MASTSLESDFFFMFFKISCSKIAFPGTPNPAHPEITKNHLFTHNTLSSVTSSEAKQSRCYPRHSQNSSVQVTLRSTNMSSSTLCLSTWVEGYFQMLYPFMSQHARARPRQRTKYISNEIAAAGTRTILANS